LAELARTTVGLTDQADKTGTSRIAWFIDPGFFLEQQNGAW